MAWAIRAGHPVMGLWLSSVLHVPNQASIYLRIGRQNTISMAPPLFVSNILLTHSYTHSKQLIRTFIMDGNFSAEHMKSRSGALDAPLSAGMAFMANPEVYKAHMDSVKAKESKEVCTGLLSVDGSQLMSS